jgi:membrane protein YdbS with pleckstrin-like domain
MAGQATVVEPSVETREEQGARAQEAAFPPEEPASGPAIDPTRVAAGTALLAAVGLGIALGRRASQPDLRPGEEVELSVRPRKVVWRYLVSLGLWELERRATRFSVTDQRLLIQEGLVRRVVCAVPLGSVRRVVTRTGPWEGYVMVQTGAGKDALDRPIGPLRTPVARRFAAAIGAPHLHEA